MTSSKPSPADRPDLDRESLSALFDGELSGDASRFAMKRLAQDVQWRRACGDWQLAGDVLRGQSMAGAPEGFAERIQSALALEERLSPPSIAAARITGRTSRRGWMGGAALAASVAVAAMLVAQPFEESQPGPADPPQVAAFASGTPAPADNPLRAVAAEEDPKPASVQRARIAATRAARRPRPAPAAGVPAIEAAGAGASGVSDAAVAVAPFQVPTVPGAPRPWPRAVMAGYPAAGALTASYGNREVGVADSPTFYPFEPHLPQQVDDTSTAPLP